jgi:hypothetical protein
MTDVKERVADPFAAIRKDAAWHLTFVLIFAAAFAPVHAQVAKGFLGHQQYRGMVCQAMHRPA